MATQTQERKRTYDPGKPAEAIHLSDGKFFVQSFTDPTIRYFVDVWDFFNGCECPDHEYRVRPARRLGLEVVECKHVSHARERLAKMNAKPDPDTDPDDYPNVARMSKPYTGVPIPMPTELLSTDPATYDRGLEELFSREGSTLGQAGPPVKPLDATRPAWTLEQKRVERDRRAA